MSIFGEPCSHCENRRTRRKFEGRPLCANCRLQVQAEREEKRACPVDGTPMRKGAIQDVIIDRCPQCNGIWLDGGELDTIKDMVKDENRGQFASGFVTGMIVG